MTPGVAVEKGDSHQIWARCWRSTVPYGPQRLGDRRDEAFGVGGTLEDRPAANGTVQDVKRQTAGGDTMQA